MITFLLLTTLLWNFTVAADFSIYIDTTSPVRNVTEKFLSITLDTCNAMDSKNITWLQNSTWFGLNFTYVTPLAKALAPSYLRVGGSGADHVTYVVSPDITTTNDNYAFTAADMDQLYNFASNSGLRLIFDLNLLHRNGSVLNETTWDPTNTIQLLDYISNKGYSMDFELGNEPDLYDAFERLTPAQVAQGYKALRSVLDSYDLYKNSILVGPALAGIKIGNGHYQFIKDFLDAGGRDFIDALTFHHYYGISNNNTSLEESECLNYKTLDSLLDPINLAKNLSFKSLWLGETSSFAGGGAQNISDTFIAGFLWIDKLGLSALNGLDVVARQELHGCWTHTHRSYYALLDQESMRPNPDYYLTLLYKKLVGNTIYNLTIQPSNNNLRLYAASSLHSDGFVIYGSNLDNVSSTIDVPSLSNKQVTVYLLNSNDTRDLRSKTSTLNGQAIGWNSHQSGPNLQGLVTTLPVEISGYSQFFLVVNQSKITQCPDGWYPLTTVKNKCIKIMNETQALFSARFDCSTYGTNASVLSIDNAFENSEIAQQANHGNCNQYYIGLIRDGNNWVWSNNDQSNYRQWASGYPTNGNTQNCVMFDAQTGTWSNSDCDKLQCYFCQQYF